MRGCYFTFVVCLFLVTKITLNIRRFWPPFSLNFKPCYNYLKHLTGSGHHTAFFRQISKLVKAKVQRVLSIPKNFYNNVYAVDFHCCQ